MDRQVQTEFCLEPTGSPHLTHTVDLFVRCDANNADILQGCLKFVCQPSSSVLDACVPVLPSSDTVCH